jgi:hypothetical protein
MQNYRDTAIIIFAQILGFIAKMFFDQPTNCKVVSIRKRKNGVFNIGKLGSLRMRISVRGNQYEIINKGL